eukprot:4097165-Prymnesium_polylepis.1
MTAATAGISGISQPIADQRGVFMLCVGFIYIPIGMLVLVGGTLYIGVRLLISSALRAAAQEGHAPSISFLARQRVVRHGSAYLVLHSMQLFVCLILVLISPNGEWRFTWYALTLLLCGRPIVTFVGWLVINDIVFLLFGICSFTKPWRAAARMEQTRREPAWRRHGFVTSLTPRLLENVAATSSTATAPPVPDRSRGLIGWLLSAPEEAREWRRHGGKEDVGFQAELRFEVLYDVAVGIGELAQEERHADGKEAAFAAGNRACPLPLRARGSQLVSTQ